MNNCKFIQVNLKHFKKWRIKQIKRNCNFNPMQYLFCFQHIGFQCRCDHEFCAMHRHADAHNCEFDYRSYDRVKLEKANPICQSEKIQKI